MFVGFMLLNIPWIIRVLWQSEFSGIPDVSETPIFSGEKKHSNKKIQGMDFLAVHETFWGPVEPISQCNSGGSSDRKGVGFRGAIPMAGKCHAI